jgi:hypothetical protein
MRYARPHAPQKITFGEMRSSGARGLLIYCADYHCSHSSAISANRWPDDVRLSDIEPLFTCQACGRKGGDVRPDGISLLRSRSGGVKYPHDMPPFRFPPSPTFGDSSMHCHRNSLVSVLAAAGAKSSVPCHCGPGAALLLCNTFNAVPTIDDRLASEANRGPDHNSRCTISHSRFDGFVPILSDPVGARPLPPGIPGDAV